MKTYSDALNPIRVFLEPLKPTILERDTGFPGGVLTERWSINGTEIILRIQPEGSWEVFVPVTRDPNPLAKITALERYLAGRPDLDTLTSMANLCDLFLDRLREMPTCTDPLCGQTACEDNRNLRQTVTSFKSTLFPMPKEKTNVRS